MALVNESEVQISIQRQCELLGLARSSYYYQPATETEENLVLMRRIDEIHLKYPFYGVLNITQQLRTAKNLINEKRVRRLMRLMGIEALYPKPGTSKACKWNERFPYLLNGLCIDHPNQVWSMDITYIPMRKGFMYLCAIIDWYSRYLLSWALNNSLNVEFCIEALQKAVFLYGPAAILNTDQGSQFTCDSFIEKVKCHGMAFSMDGKGRALDNIRIERFWRSLKYENIYLNAYENIKELSRGITDYIQFYNCIRKHQGLDFLTPREAFRKTALRA
jgi:putative transposase